MNSQLFSLVMWLLATTAVHAMTLTNLPNDALRHVFSKLDPASFSNLASASRATKEIARETDVLGELLIREFPNECILRAYMFPWRMSNTLLLSYVIVNAPENTDVFVPAKRMVERADFHSLAMLKPLLVKKWTAQQATELLIEASFYVDKENALTMIKLLLDCGARDQHSIALSCALVQFHAPVVKELLARNDYSDAPFAMYLEDAIDNDNQPVMEFLQFHRLIAGVNPQRFYINIFDRACEMKNGVHMLKLVFDKCTPEERVFFRNLIPECMLLASRHGNTNVLSFLQMKWLQHYAPPGLDLYSVLLPAVENSQLDVVRFILNQGVRVPSHDIVMRRAYLKARRNPYYSSALKIFLLLKRHHITTRI